MGIPRSDPAYGVKIILLVSACAGRASPSPVITSLRGHAAVKTSTRIDRASAVAPHTLGVLRPMIQSIKNGLFVLDLFHGEGSQPDPHSSNNETNRTNETNYTLITLSISSQNLPSVLAVSL
jgi:hypothetical protein